MAQKALKRKKQNQYLRCISEGESLVLDPTDGTELLADATDVFIDIDPDFKRWGITKKERATQKQPVRVYEMIRDATFAQMFYSLSPKKQGFRLTQAQIKQFIKKHQSWLRTDGYATFFLFKSNNQFFVAGVDLTSAGTLLVRVLRFANSHVWHAGYRLRLVVPKLA